MRAMRRDRARTRPLGVVLRACLWGALVLPGTALAAQATSQVTVRLGERVRTVATVLHPEGGLAARADLLAAALGGQVVPLDARGTRLRFEVGATGIDLMPGTALALVDDDTLPLTATVYRHERQLYVPMTLATELLPRLGAGVMYDAAKSELRRFVAVVAASRVLPQPPAERPRAAPADASYGTALTVPARPVDVPRADPGEVRQRHVVVVDAGHGGPDHGMSGPIGAARPVYEKTITLSVAKALERALAARGVHVVMTRTTDTLIALADRGRLANQAKGDLFLSIHVNAANPRWRNPGSARGFETYFLAEAKTEDEKRVEAMENEVIKFETSVDASRDDPLGFIIRDMAQNEHLRESSRLASLIQDGMRMVHPGPNRGVKQAGFRVLVTAFMPSVLVEIGFGSNRSEAAYMTDPNQQAALANTLADSVLRYLAEYERKVGG